MGTRQKRNIQFIVVSDPTNATSTNSPQKAHSHAARIAHARTRLARTAEYNARRSYKADVPVDDKDRYQSKSGSATRLQLQLRSVPSPLRSMSADRRDPFNSSATDLSPIECFLLDHYAQVVVPTLNIQCRNLKDLGESTERMLREWVRLALTDAVILQGILLAACRHLIERGYQVWRFEELAAGYKVRCLRDVIDAIGSEDLDMDVTFARIFTLANDEIWLGNLDMFRRHAAGAIKLVVMHGGPGRLGLNGYLQSLFRIVLDKEEALREESKPCAGLTGGIDRLRDILIN
ncbi:hypothetical protein P171DRAFT_516997 [Karstenula rhodostoma CBS 690.94]|uniref:Uncharacterized protein n=1 Tax=Karstenula rhodostoma CBS 690.94 TaxID=1392251 RepID=A0A9P4PUY2_9PLEO|nr:hypothetical protein P171DRAFT_516997 [Karstenula rhodostoma CBS 690.94]